MSCFVNSVDTATVDFILERNPGSLRSPHRRRFSRCHRDQRHWHNLSFYPIVVDLVHSRSDTCNTLFSFNGSLTVRSPVQHQPVDGKHDCLAVRCSMIQDVSPMLSATVLARNPRSTGSSICRIRRVKIHVSTSCPGSAAEPPHHPRVRPGFGHRPESVASTLCSTTMPTSCLGSCLGQVQHFRRLKWLQPSLVRPLCEAHLLRPLMQCFRACQICPPWPATSRI